MNRLLEASAPLPAIGRTGNVDHAETMVFRVAARVANDDHVIAGLQGIARHALPSQLSACAPLYGIALHHTGFILGFHLNEGMRIAEQKLYEFTFDLWGLIFKIRSCKRVVGKGPTTGHDRRRGDH